MEGKQSKREKEKMNKHLKRRKNFSIIFIIVGALLFIFNKNAHFIFGPLLMIWVGIILFFQGVSSLIRLYFHGDI